MAAYVENDYFQVALRAEFDHLLRGLVEHHDDPNAIATSVLEAVRTIYGFDAGIIYRPNYSLHRLEGYAAIPKGRDLNSEPFCYQFDQPSLACHVFKTKAAKFIDDPNDPIVNPRGVKDFNIRSPLIGMPLLVENQPVGVMVVWSEVNREQSPPTKDHIKLLEPFAGVAAVPLGVAQAQWRRVTFLHEVEKILKKMQTEIDLGKNLQAIMKGIQSIGFDRVRVFEFKYGDSMVPRDCLGMTETDAKKFKDCIQTVQNNPYTRDLVADVLCARDDWALVARLYPTDELGADPNAAALGKPADLPWVDVPLIRAGKLYGEIAADNLGTRREINGHDFEYMSFFGALAAQAFSIAEERGMLNAQTMGMLYNRVGLEEHKDVILRCLLRYLTHGEGPGFSRALFLELNESTGKLALTEGVGSLKQDRFTEIAWETRRMPLEEVLAQADQRSDEEDFCRPLRSVSLDWQDARIRTWLDIPEAAACRLLDEHLPDGLKDLGHLLNSDHFIATVVRAEKKVLGLLVADRRWQVRNLGEGDQAVLSTFARRAGLILMHDELRRQVRESADQANLGMLTQGLTHELRQPLNVLQKDTYMLEESLSNTVSEPDSSCLQRISRSVKRMVDTVDRLQALIRPRETRVEMDIDTLIRDLFLRLEFDLQERGITLRSDVPQGLPRIHAIPALLTVALDNLLSNAKNAFVKVERPNKMIHIRAKRHDHSNSVLLEVEDNGPGISAEVLEHLQQPGAGYTTDPHRGLGLGLAIVRRVAHLHEGAFHIESQPGQRTVARLTIPLAPKEPDDAG